MNHERLYQKEGRILQLKTLFKEIFVRFNVGNYKKWR
jgi:hypothetical protein